MYVWYIPQRKFNSKKIQNAMCGQRRGKYGFSNLKKKCIRNVENM